MPHSQPAESVCWTRMRCLSATVILVRVSLRPRESQRRKSISGFFWARWVASGCFTTIWGGLFSSKLWEQHHGLLFSWHKKYSHPYIDYGYGAYKSCVHAAWPSRFWTIKQGRTLQFKRDIWLCLMVTGNVSASSQDSGLSSFQTTSNFCVLKTLATTSPSPQRPLRHPPPRPPSPCFCTPNLSVCAV